MNNTLNHTAYYRPFEPSPYLPTQTHYTPSELSSSQDIHTCRHTSAHCCTFNKAGYCWKAHLQNYSHTSVHIEYQIPILWILKEKN